MIFAVLALRREDAEARMARVRRAAPGQPRVMWDGAAGVAVWPSEERSVVDAVGTRAYTGPLEGDLLAGRAQGRFAAAQLAQGGLVLARGRMGGRSLFWGRDGSTVLACTRLPPLLDALTTQPPPDALRLAETLIGDLHGRPHATSYEGVTRLASGDVLRFDAAGTMTASTLQAPRLTPLTGTPDELALALRDEIFAAVRRSVDGLGRVAVLAGGGVDSSALLATVMTLVRGGTLADALALSLDFAGPGDDRPYMDDMAASLGIVPVRVSPRTFAPQVRRSLIIDGQPYASAMGGWELGFLELAKERGAEALVGGLGGDELFDGDPRCFATQALHGHVLGAARAAFELKVPWRSSRLGRLREFVLRPIAVHVTPRPVRRFLRRHRRTERRVPWAGPVLREVLRREVPEAPSDFGPRTPSETFHRLSDSKWALEISEGQCSLDAHVGCATRTPFHDEALVSFVARLPPELMFTGGYLRGLFRRAFVGLVPDRVRLRTDKAGFEPALEEMHAAMGGRGALAELAAMRALARLGVVEAAAYREAFDAFVRGDIGDEGWGSLWPALSVEAFALRALGMS
jgi:asparagine synthase (glutamine-hydrolysing)